MAPGVPVSRRWVLRTSRNRAATFTAPALHSCNRPFVLVAKVICLLRPVCWAMTRCNCWPPMCTAFPGTLIGAPPRSSRHRNVSVNGPLGFRTSQRGAESSYALRPSVAPLCPPASHTLFSRLSLPAVDWLSLVTGRMKRTCPMRVSAPSRRRQSPARSSLSPQIVDTLTSISIDLPPAFRSAQIRPGNDARPGNVSDGAAASRLASALPRDARR